MNTLFWLGMSTPLGLVCLIFVVVSLAGRKQDLAEPHPVRSEETGPEEPADHQSPGAA